MRFERIARDIDAGFHRGDPVIDDQADRHFAQTHPDHFADSDRRVRDPGAKPKAKKTGDDDREDQNDEPEEQHAEESRGSAYDSGYGGLGEAESENDAMRNWRRAAHSREHSLVA